MSFVKFIVREKSVKVLSSLFLWHSRLCVASVLGSGRVETLLPVCSRREESGSTVWERTTFSTASAQPVASWNIQLWWATLWAWGSLTGELCNTVWVHVGTAYCKSRNTVQREIFEGINFCVFMDRLCSAKIKTSKCLTLVAYTRSLCVHSEL